jgi:dTDP-4-amino-4,6-dideoxygalactose transaminase
VAERAPVPMVDLRAQYGRVRAEIEDAVRRVVESGQFVGGEECARFEAEFAAFCGVAHACGVANGTDALTLALRALEVGPGDEVVTVANTFIGTGEAILLCGARPVFVDVEPETFTMDPARLERALTPRTRAIVPVHLYGHPADMHAIGEVARRRGIPVLEDAAQAHGAEVAGRRAGGLGHAACFSFYPSKNLGAYGDAGAVTSDDAEFVGRVRRLANHGAGGDRYHHLVAGTNSRLDALQAAVLRVKLRHLEAWSGERRARVDAYTRALEAIAGLRLPRERSGARSAWYLYTVRAHDRDGLRARLSAKGIAAAIHYPRPIHLQPAMAGGSAVEGDLPVSERLSREVLSLPLYPELPLETVEWIAQEVRAHYAR